VSDHLTSLDATFLELEEADESAHMHTGVIMVFDPRPDGGSPSREEVCDYLESRLGQLPRYRQRLSEPRTGGMSWPEWEDDPAFDVRRHVARAALPTPGGDREMAEWASGFFSQRLDRHRPLWEMALVEGLANGRYAIATKTHHCMVDGVGSADVGHLLLDTTPDAAPVARSASSASGGSGAGETPTARSTAPGSLARLGRAWEGLLPLEQVLHAAEMGTHGVLHPRDALRTAKWAVAVIVREELRGAPSTSLNRPIGTLRRFEVVRVPLAELKEIKSSLGGTINDVVLAVTASGLRALLQSRGEALPAAGLRAMVPINVRAAGEHLALGNRVSSLYVELPVAGSDPVVRYRETVARSESLKSAGQQAQGTTAVIDLAGLAPPMIHAALAQASYATRLFNVTITNVPGPQQTLYALGSPMREVYPLVPLAAEHAVGVAAASYDGSVFFGVVADRDAVPDLDVLLSSLSAAVQDLLSAARTQGKGPSDIAPGDSPPRRRRAAPGR
jgi:WS/DGAT/MGAT family acyltransferase